MAFNRCSTCRSFISHSFVARGVDVYRCNGEDTWNDAGRYFIQSGANGLIQVTPVKEGKGWSYTIVDTERVRLAEAAKQIEEELEKRRLAFAKSQAILDSRWKKKEEPLDS